MSTFKGHAKSLGEQYVFYQRLKTDGYYPKLSQYVSNASYRIYTQTQKYAADASAVRAQAQAEFAKEKMLLQQKFGVNINFDYYRGQNDFKEIIDALNTCLNLKEVYQRNIQLIKYTKGMKGVFSWFPTYFMHAWEDYWPQICSLYEANFMAKIPAGEALSNALDVYLPEICVSGIERMLNGPEVEYKMIDPSLKNAYSELVNQIGSVYTEGSVAQQIYKAYELDKLKEVLTEGMEPTKKLKANSFKSKAKKMTSKRIHQRGGFSLEAIETAIFQMISSGISGSGVIHSGSKNIKADNILTLSVDPTIVAEALEEARGDRDSNIAALSKLGSKLSNLDEGFIVYSSDKNYSLNSSFGGFDAGRVGKSDNVANFLNNVYQADSSVSTLIGAIQQLGKGAMLQGRKAEFEKLLAQDVAYMLFDDFTTIGTVSTGGNAIHIMNLNGIMMPMSVFLSMLADAIESVTEDEIRKLVNVTINAPSIRYLTQDDQNAAYPNNPHAAWEYQKQYALEKTKITAKFLRDFKSFITALL